MRPSQEAKRRRVVCAVFKASPLRLSAKVAPTQLSQRDQFVRPLLQSFFQAALPPSRHRPLHRINHLQLHGSLIGLRLVGVRRWECLQLFPKLSMHPQTCVPAPDKRVCAFACHAAYVTGNGSDNDFVIRRKGSQNFMRFCRRRLCHSELPGAKPACR